MIDVDKIRDKFFELLGAYRGYFHAGEVSQGGVVSAYCRQKQLVTDLSPLLKSHFQDIAIDISHQKQCYVLSAIARSNVNFDIDPAPKLDMSVAVPDHSSSAQVPNITARQIVRAVVMGFFQDMTAAEFILLLNGDRVSDGTKARIHKPPKSDEVVIMLQEGSGEFLLQVVDLKTGTGWTFDIESRTFRTAFVFLDFA